MTFDQSILTFLATFRTPRINQVMSDFTALGSFSVITLITIITLLILANLRDRAGIYQLLTVFAGAIVIPRVLKTLIGRARPDFVDALTHVSDSSFPSGHSFSAAAIYLTLAYFGSRYRHRLRHELFFTSLMMLLVLLVGLSRMFLGVHYPTDVLGGIALGAGWCGITILLFRSRERRELA